MFNNELVKKFSRIYNAGKLIFNEGDFGRELFIIIKGEVEIYRLVDEKKRTLAILKDGDIFGELAVIDKFPRSANAVAIKDTIVLAVNSSAFESVILSNQDFTKKIIRLLAARLRKTNDIVLSIYQKDREEKVLSALNAFYNLELVSKNIKIKDKIEKSKFYDYAENTKGIPKNIVENCLIELKKQGLIDIEGNIINCKNIDRRNKSNGQQSE
ncbi:MAG TPA: cyclic nucleotide-binding domain-containing protein [Exilispira sp.]|nr:cyclic nucleotide-binding domain-containing protein [Exilispira sp.]